MPDTRFALMGNPGSGKTSIGDAYIKLFGGTRLSFAKGVKQEVALALGAIDAQYLLGDSRRMHEVADRHFDRMADPATKDEYRRILQVWGTDIRRNSDSDYWVNRLMDELDRTTGNIVIDDCRFPNEFRALDAAGFTFIRLEDGPTTRPQDPTAAVHESESYWPTFTYDYVLPYERGPGRQAETIRDLLVQQVQG